MWTIGRNCNLIITIRFIEMIKKITKLQYWFFALMEVSEKDFRNTKHPRTLAL